MVTVNREGLRPFLNRVLLHSDLGEAERQAILDISSRLVEVSANTTLVSPGQTVDHSIMVVDGTLARFDQMRNGARQITAFYIAGDMSDLHSVVAPVTGWGVSSLGKSTILRVPHRELRAVVEQHPAIAFAFWRDTTLDASILAKWIATVGRRSARSRLAHLICELAIRSERAGIGTRHAFTLSATQEHIGDAMGLTAVHTNRTLQFLRAEDLVIIQRHNIAIPDWNRLVTFAEFDPTFLLLQ